VALAHLTRLFHPVCIGMICVQDKQLCVLLKLQVLSAVSCIHVGILYIRWLHITPVLHQLLAGKILNSVYFYGGLLCRALGVSVCQHHLSSVTHVLWLNGTSYQKAVWTTVSVSFFYLATDCCVNGFCCFAAYNFFWSAHFLELLLYQVKPICTSTFPDIVEGFVTRCMFCAI